MQTNDFFKMIFLHKYHQKVYRRYLAETLSIRRKTLFNQSINQSKRRKRNSNLVIIMKTNLIVR